MNKTKNLIKLEVKLKDEVRTIISGIAIDYDPNILIGKKVTLLSNLVPRKIKGVESNGMILLAKDRNGSFVFISPNEEGVQNGTPIA